MDELKQIEIEEIKLQEQMDQNMTHLEQQIQKNQQSKDKQELDAKNVNELYEKLLKEQEQENLEMENEDKFLEQIKEENENYNQSIQVLDKQLQLTQNQQQDSLKQMEFYQEEIGKFGNKEKQIIEIRSNQLNQYHDILGNIRVYCRIRNFKNEQEKQENEEELLKQEATQKLMEIAEKNESNIIINLPKKYVKSSNSQLLHTFNLEHIYSQFATQLSVFGELKQLVQSTIDGYNVCIFAYGQTGSGKTYTMNGDIENEQNTGLTLRSVQYIFDQIEDMKKIGWEYKISVSFTEIYNETVKCLITQNVKNKQGYFQFKSDDHIKQNLAQSQMNQQSHQVQHQYSEFEVKSIQEILQYIKTSQNNRIVKKTQMNDHSSRSHSIFQLKLNGTLQNQKQNQDNNEPEQMQTSFLKSRIKNKQNNNSKVKIIQGTLNLIDLAGSESLKQSQATGDEAIEARAINKSLSALKDVIMALATRKDDSHIPYRNSKLTEHLKDYLGGKSKTLMLVNISPLFSDIQQTIATLRFAEIVKSCETQKKNDNQVGGGNNFQKSKIKSVFK